MNSLFIQNPGIFDDAIGGGILGLRNAHPYKSEASLNKAPDLDYVFGGVRGVPTLQPIRTGLTLALNR